MRRTQLSAHGSQRRNIFGPARDRAITKPIPTNRSNASGINRSAHLVPHRGPPIDLTGDSGDDDSECSFATDEDGEDGDGQDPDDGNGQDLDDGNGQDPDDWHGEHQHEANPDEQPPYEHSMPLYPSPTSPKRTKFHLVEETIYTVYYEHRHDYNTDQFSILGAYTDIADANAAVLQCRYAQGHQWGFEWDDYRELWARDGTVSIRGRGEEDSYCVSIRKMRLGRRVLVGR